MVGIVEGFFVFGLVDIGGEVQIIDDFIGILIEEGEVFVVEYGVVQEYRVDDVD